ncbi:MAG: RNA-directed DNA polymerase [Alphaproteobacteria bacterium]|nr:RNA-directed DNA polymerase [Alphaproteobacteria bacterium]
MSRKDLAGILGYNPSSLTAIIYKTPNASKYTTFEIDKKSGGKRTIKAPSPKLKKLQSHLSHVLYQCISEIEKNRECKLKPISFGFRKDRSIFENAARHKRRRWVLNIDPENFFPSFNFGRVRGFFLKDRAFALNPEVATTIAQIACDGAALPQGSPCSPVISELIAQILDMRLVRLAKKFGVTYTRYADDITFSTSQKEFPTGLARPDGTNPTIWHLSDDLVGKITNSGFTINSNKTRMHFRGSRQMVTGLVVNEKVNIRSDYYRRARAMCHHLFRNGQYFKSMLPQEKDGEEPKPELTGNLNPLEGILSYVYAVTQREERRNDQDQRQKPRAIRKLYRRFLFYKYFIALKAPLIVTEGKTDPIHLREAVKSRTKFHPALGKPGKDRFDHAVRYFNHGGLASEILDLAGGGTSNLRSIPIDYKRNLHANKKEQKAIARCPMRFPVILVLDNDDGLKTISSTIKEMFKVEFVVSSDADFYHVTDNLYVVKTPENGNKNTSIEDLFPDKWRNMELRGKKFSSANKIDSSKEYGKEVFAKSVVKPNACQIDFSAFDPLLERLCKVIEHHSGARAS